MKYTKEELCLIWLDSFCGLEYKHKKELYQYIEGKESIKDFIAEQKTYIVNAVGENSYNTLLNSANKVYLDYVLKNLEDKGVKVITLFSEGYPERLKNTELPPLVLYCKGDTALLDGEIFGIVGSRRSLPSSINFAKNYSESLSGHFTLVTGIAEGVDKAVLESALANNGKVISVIAGGFDNIYPKSNENLLKEVVKYGLAISEYPPDIVPKPYFFPVRNRIIAGLSKGVLIVSGGMISGTLYTAEYAEEYGREVFAIPYGIGVESGKGCNDLIKRGARLTDSPDDILEFFGLEENKEEQELSSEEEKIISALKDGNKHIEEISKKTGLQIYEIAPIISGMEIKGLVVKNGQNIFGLKS